MPEFNHELFGKRLGKFYQHWKAQKSTEAWGSECGALIVYNGASTDEVEYKLGGGLLDLYFFGYELVDSLLAFLDDKLYIVAGKKKRKYKEKMICYYRHSLQYYFF